MKTSRFSHEDIRFINRIKELIQQRNIEIFEQKIQHKQKELELLQVESANSISLLSREADNIQARLEEKGVKHKKTTK